MKKTKKWTALFFTAALAVSTCVTAYPKEVENTCGAAQAGEEDTEKEKCSGGGEKNSAEEEKQQSEEKVQKTQPEKSNGETAEEPEKGNGEAAEEPEKGNGEATEQPEKESEEQPEESEKQPEEAADPTPVPKPEITEEGPLEETDQEDGSSTEKVNMPSEYSEEQEDSRETEKTGEEKTEEASALSGVEQVKKMIEGLPVLDDVKLSDARKIQAAWDAYHALSAEDQAILDNETGNKSGQSYGRDLESAYWGLKALSGADASTVLPAGTYDETTDPALRSEYSKGKSSSSRERPWSVKSVTVDANGQVTGLITVESSSYTYIRTNGQTYPCTSSTGNSEFAGVPIDLNSTFYIAAYSTSMKGEIAFSITTFIEESGGGDAEEIPLTGISLSAETLSMYAQEVHEALKVSLEPENTTYKGKIIWSSSDPEIVTVDAKNGEISALCAGSAVITAKAGDCTASCKVHVKEKLADGRISFRITNKTAMFKVVDAYIVTKKGKSIMYFTLSGEGYRELYLGSYRQAVATGSDSSKWISGKRRTDHALLSYTEADGTSKKEKASGKWQFAIPVAAGSSCIQVQSLSHTHKKDGFWWYPRQLSVDTENKTLVVEDYKGSEALAVKNSAKALSVTSASLMTVGGPHSNNYRVSLTMNLDASKYTKAYLGTAKNAVKHAGDSFAVKNHKISFVVEQIVGTGNGASIASRIGSPFALSLYSSSKKKWTAFEVTIDQNKGTLTVKPFGKDSQDTGNDEFENNGGSENNGKVDPSRLQANSNTMPGTVDNSTTLADGVYTSGQFKFTFSGGSGRVIVTCQKVEVKNGKAYATITFERSSKQGGSSSYDSVRANGQVYSGNNTFTIPVELNKNNTIVGRTIAMSAPHWVEYTIFIGISEPGTQTGQDVSENTTELDEKAPSIMGLQGGKELKLPHTDKVKAFSYEDGYYLIEVDTVKDTFRDSKEYKEYIEKQKEKAAEQEEEITEEIPEEEGSGSGDAGEDSVSAQAASLYSNQIVKYLVIPEGEEAPAGLEKEVILIRQPCEKVYVSSKSALKMLCGLSLQERIDSVGIEKEALAGPEYESIVASMELPEEEKGHIAWGGSYDAWEIRTLLMHKTDLMIQAPDILPSKMETLEEDMDNFIRLAQRSYQMGAAMFLDRSSEEKTEAARAEWYKVYGILFNCTEQAQKAYEAAAGTSGQEQ